MTAKSYFKHSIKEPCGPGVNHWTSDWEVSKGQDSLEIFTFLKEGQTHVLGMLEAVMDTNLNCKNSKLVLLYMNYSLPKSSTFLSDFSDTTPRAPTPSMIQHPVMTSNKNCLQTTRSTFLRA